MSLRGYCRTLSERIDCRPAITITRLTTIARTGRLMKRSVNRMSALLRPRRGVVGRLDRVVDLDRRPRPQLEHARRHDLVARLDPRQDRHLVATRAAQLH